MPYTREGLHTVKRSPGGAGKLVRREAWCRHIDPDPDLPLPQPAPEPPEDPELEAEMWAVMEEYADLPDEEFAKGE